VSRLMGERDRSSIVGTMSLYFNREELWDHAPRSDFFKKACNSWHPMAPRKLSAAARRLA